MVKILLFCTPPPHHLRGRFCIDIQQDKKYFQILTLFNKQNLVIYV